MAESITQNNLDDNDDDDNTVGPHQAETDFFDDSVDEVAYLVRRFLGIFVHRYVPW
jgi:hypothetical protein